MTTATNFQPGDKSRTRASLKRQLLAVFTDASCLDANSELTLTVPADRSHDILLRLRDDFDFSQCMDVTAVDYSGWHQSDWQTTPNTAFSRARGALQSSQRTTHPCRFAVVYHLLSLRSNDRLRVKVYLPDDTPLAVASVVDIWSGVAWFEREVYDMFGIAFTGHPDLRRILTDYGFVGHPLRKDFPLIGEVEVRYDADQQRVIYQPVTITPRVNVPRVVRHDSRYARVQIDGDGAQHG